MDKSILISDDLIKEAQEATGEPDERAAIEKTLRRVFAGRRKHKDLLDLVGKIDFYPGYDPKKLRS